MEQKRLAFFTKYSTATMVGYAVLYATGSPSSHTLNHWGVSPSEQLVQHSTLISFIR